ncbi:MAG: DUF3024 domain-containing protein [Gemmatimonadaceae bacterium]|nr:DUF3024 domain-containing protein [Gemmatimonadaceae bacterium]
MAIRKPSKTKRAPRSTLSDLQLARVRTLFDPRCTPHPDPRIASQLRHAYRLEGPAVIYFESRPDWRGGPEWMVHDIAKFRFTKSTGQWSLYCQFRDLKWHGYEPLPHHASLAVLLAEVERDPTCIFFG